MKEKSSCKTDTKIGKGIRIYKREDAKNPWYVQWRDQGTRKNKSFPNQKDAKEFAIQLTQKTKDYGKQALNFDPVLWTGFLSFREELKKMGILELTDALQIIKDAPKQGNGFKVPLEDLVKKFLQTKDGHYPPFFTDFRLPHRYFTGFYGFF